MKFAPLRRAAFAALLASACFTPAMASDVTSLGANNVLVTVDSAAPSTVKRSVAITGVGAGQTLLGIDARPATSNRAIYSVSNTGQLYVINSLTGAATAIGTPIPQISSAAGAQLGIDFNPTVDRLRLVTSTGVNLRVNPNDGSVTVDGGLNVPPGTTQLGVGAAAYTNSLAGATSTTLYVINPATGTLSIQNPPNAGTLNAVGALGVTATGNAGFDIQSVTGAADTALATMTSAGGVTSLYRVNLTTGAATLLGTFGTAGSYNGLAFTAATYATSSLTANQLAVAQRFDGFTGNPSTGLISAFSALDALSADGRAAVFSQLGPNSYSILPEVVLQGNEAVDSTVRRYLRDMRAGGAGNSDTGATMGSDRPIGGFLVGTGRTGNFKARGDRNAMDYGATGMIGGLDIRLAPTTLIGVTGGIDRATVRLNPISPNSKANSWFIGGYGTVAAGPLYIDLDGSYGKTKFNLRRNVNLGTTSSATARTEATHWSIAGTTGLSIDAGGLELEPYGGVRYVDVKVDGFSEGAGVTNLSVGNQHIKSFQSIAGLRIGADMKSGSATIRPSIRGEWRHEFKNDGPRLLQASFNDSGISTPFTYTTTPMGKDYAVVGAGLTISGDSPVAMVVDYTGQIKGGYDIHSAQVGMRISF